MAENEVKPLWFVDTDWIQGTMAGCRSADRPTTRFSDSASTGLSGGDRDSIPNIPHAGEETRAAPLKLRERGAPESEGAPCLAPGAWRASARSGTT